MFCGAQYKHHTFTPIIKHHYNCNNSNHWGKMSRINKYMRNISSNLPGLFCHPLIELRDDLFVLLFQQLSFWAGKKKSILMKCIHSENSASAWPRSMKPRGWRKLCPCNIMVIHIISIHKLSWKQKMCKYLWLLIICVHTHTHTHTHTYAHTHVKTSTARLIWGNLHSALQLLRTWQNTPAPQTHCVMQI